MARDWAGLCPYSKVSKVTVGLESYGAEPREVRSKHRTTQRDPKPPVVNKKTLSFTRLGGGLREHTQGDLSALFHVTFPDRNYFYITL